MREHNDTRTVTFVVEAVNKSGGVLRDMEIGVDALRRNLAAAAGALGTAFKDLMEVGNFVLDEVEIGVEVGAEGRIAFISSASGSASFKLKFKPKKQQ